MATVLRVKRRCNEEPLEALVFACKRRKKLEEISEDKDSFATILKFSTTVKAQENDLSVLLPVDEREDIWKARLNHKVDISKKIREQRKKNSENSRFKVVNCFRHVEVEDPEKEDDEKRDVIIFDIESSEQNMQENNKESPEDEHYVYDIYYGQTSNECDFTTLDHLVDIMPVSSFHFGSNGASDEDSVADDDNDDSNDESNWRNDYPDSDHSINEDDMRLALQMDDMNLGNDLSSSDDEGLIYGVETDPQDVEYYGEVYAKYKARIRREFNEDITSSDEDDNQNSLEGGGEVDSDENEDPVLRFM
ncbi:Uncharacterized protein GBIM_04505 [Gryllus bimaculatus]|nr:Uncharacterized protein GBIM_04505 [Gryllus bimaculatus]